MTTQSDPTQSGPLAEYASLRAGVMANVAHRHNLFALQLTISGAIFSFAIGSANTIGILLIVPITAFLLAARYADQVHNAEMANVYIAEQLSERVDGGLNWVRWISRNPRTRGIGLSLMPLLLAFPGVGALALATTANHVFLEHRSVAPRLGTAVIWFMGLALTVLAVLLFLDLIRTVRTLDARMAAAAATSPADDQPTIN